MNFYNIFQGNKLINDAIIKGLFLEKTDNQKMESEKYYFQAFFYLTKRFGNCKIYDDYKDGGVWTFLVKNYKIQILLDSYSVSFIIYGNSKFKNYSMLSPYWIARHRIYDSVKNKMYVETENPTKIQNKTNTQIWDIFLKENKINNTWTQEAFDKWIEANSRLWFEFTQNYNSKIIGINQDEYFEKYGRFYKNSKTKHALKTLEQFLNNMLTPIYIRDVGFNILGNCESEFLKFTDNIKIELEV